MPQLLELEARGDSHTGLSRNNNEDGFEIFDPFRLFVVVDGMGGQGSGVVATRLTLETIGEFFGRLHQAGPWSSFGGASRGDEDSLLVMAIKLANLRIFEKGSPGALRGLGAAAVALLATPQRAIIAHVGDCRCYRLRGGTIERLTEDHSLLNDFIKLTHPTPEEIANYPHKNVIVRALGMEETVQVDVRTETPAPGDIYLLCSDGLHDPLSDERILEIVVSSPDLATASRRLIDEALAGDCGDDITALLVRWPDAAPR